MAYRGDCLSLPHTPFLSQLLTGAQVSLAQAVCPAPPPQPGLPGYTSQPPGVSPSTVTGRDVQSCLSHLLVLQTSGWGDSSSAWPRISIPGCCPSRSTGTFTYRLLREQGTAVHGQGRGSVSQTPVLAAPALPPEGKGCLCLCRTDEQHPLASPATFPAVCSHSSPCLFLVFSPTSTTTRPSGKRPSCMLLLTCT